ncbi:hypothetical protein BDV23DRAFT_177125 [Aspergillus alliaceus]|uniref:Ferric reductase NAD binding domain-containing protein n=1 Tax=Petromyces alliaceus TaxID=209559 RepID=A0A5N7BRA7_PETAA|nr:hypothetical protein BDV23DRAFT_177125 [Aspergillus alliaceus]
MDAFAIYAIAASGTLVALFITKALTSPPEWTGWVAAFVSQHFTLPYFVNQHQLVNPWTRASVIFHLSYIAVNLFLVIFGATSVTGTGHQAGTLAVINLIFPISAIHLMTIPALKQKFDIHVSRNMCTMIGAVSLRVLTLLSLVWIHRNTWFPQLYLYIGMGIFGLTSVLQLGAFLYRNAIVSLNRNRNIKDSSGTATTAIKIRLIIPRPLKIPSVITSWSKGKQDILDLLIQPHHGITADILHHVSAIPEGSISFLALFSGPHRSSKDITYYKSALIVASGFSITAMIPFIKKMIYGYNMCTSQIHQVHLVWQVKTINIALAAQDLLNSLLKDNIMDNSYILSISIYMEKSQLVQNKLPFSKHKQAILHQGIPNYKKLISLEISRDQIKRLLNIHNKQDQTLLSELEYQSLSD